MHKRVLTIAAGYLLAPAFAFAQWTTGNASPAPTDTTSTIFDVSISIANTLFAIAFIFSIIGFAIAGTKYIVAGGGEGMLEKAKKTWIASLVGLGFALLGYVSVNLLKFFLR